MADRPISPGDRRSYLACLAADEPPRTPRRPGMRKPDGTGIGEHQPGDYCRQDEHHWSFVTPNGIYFSIYTDNPRCHKLAEHEDGTVSLSPSVLCYPGSCGVAEGWHGYLERGVWREC